MAFCNCPVGNVAVPMLDNVTGMARHDKQGDIASLPSCTLWQLALNWPELRDIDFQAWCIPGRKNVVVGLLSCWDEIVPADCTVHL